MSNNIKIITDDGLKAEKYFKKVIVDGKNVTGKAFLIDIKEGYVLCYKINKEGCYYGDPDNNYISVKEKIYGKIKLTIDKNTINKIKVKIVGKIYNLILHCFNNNINLHNFTQKFITDSVKYNVDKCGNDFAKIFMLKRYERYLTKTVQKVSRLKKIEEQISDFKKSYRAENEKAFSVQPRSVSVTPKLFTTLVYNGILKIHSSGWVSMEYPNLFTGCSLIEIVIDSNLDEDYVFNYKEIINIKEG